MTYCICMYDCEKNNCVIATITIKDRSNQERYRGKGADRDPCLLAQDLQVRRTLNFSAFVASPVFEGTEFSVCYLNKKDLTKKHILFESNLNAG